MLDMKFKNLVNLFDFHFDSFQPVSSETPYEPDANLHVVKFERTPIMSTYLVAFVIGEVHNFDHTYKPGSFVLTPSHLAV